MILTEMSQMKTPPQDVDMVVYPVRDGRHRRNETRILKRLADPLVYPLLFSSNGV